MMWHHKCKSLKPSSTWCVTLYISSCTHCWGARACSWGAGGHRAPAFAAPGRRSCTSAAPPCGHQDAPCPGRRDCCPSLMEGEWNHQVKRIFQINLSIGVKINQVCRLMNHRAGQVIIFHHLELIKLIWRVLFILTFDGAVGDGVHEHTDEGVLLAPGLTDVCLKLENRMSDF